MEVYVLKRPEIGRNEFLTTARIAGLAAIAKVYCVRARTGAPKPGRQAPAPQTSTLIEDYTKGRITPKG